MAILALDLEHTLTSSAVTCWVRPGLNDFLAWAVSHFDHVVLYTTVPPQRVRDIQNRLLELGDVTQQFASLECVDWPRRGYKDLRLVDQDWKQVIMVDDLPEEYMMPEQREQWLKIAPFNGEHDDCELKRIEAMLSAT